MKFNLARCSNKLVFGSDSNFPNGFFLLCSLSRGSREVGHPAAKLMVLAVAIFMDACIKGVQKPGILWVTSC